MAALKPLLKKESSIDIVSTSTPIKKTLQLLQATVTIPGDQSGTRIEILIEREKTDCEYTPVCVYNGFIHNIYMRISIGNKYKSTCSGKEVDGDA